MRQDRRLEPLSESEVENLGRAHALTTKGRWGANSTTLFVGSGRRSYRIAMPSRAETGRDTSADPYFMAVAHEAVPRLLEERRRLRAAAWLPEVEILARELCDAARAFASTEDNIPIESLITFDGFPEDDPTKPQPA